MRLHTACGKAQVLGGVLDTVAGEVTHDKVIISICAGISEDFIRSHTITERKGSACYAEHPYDARSWRKRNIKSGQCDR